MATNIANVANVVLIADILDSARRDRIAIAKVTLAHPELTIQDGYAIQRELCRRRLAEGEAVAGYKMGLTSPAKMQQMGVTSPIYGVLFASTRVAEGGAVRVQELIHPMVEPEVAFRLGSPLRGPECTLEQVLAATEALFPAIEIIDSRYQRYEFDLPSVIADNTSAGRFVIGTAGVPASGINLTALGVVLEKNGEIVAQGNSAAVLGNPALSVAKLANMLAEDGRELPRGSVIMSGGITAAVAVQPGDKVVCRIDTLGATSVSFM
ncbi:MAG: 2-keto-4-pentenoate hydratase [Candidatus Binatia bacterium]